MKQHDVEFITNYADMVSFMCPCCGKKELCALFDGTDPKCGVCDTEFEVRWKNPIVYEKE